MRCCDLKTWVLNFATHTSRFWNTINFILNFELQQLRAWYVYIIIVNFAIYNSRFWDIGTFILIVETYHLRGCDVVIIVSKLCNSTFAILIKLLLSFWYLKPITFEFEILKKACLVSQCNLNVTVLRWWYFHFEFWNLNPAILRCWTHTCEHCNIQVASLTYWYLHVAFWILTTANLKWWTYKLERCKFKVAT